MYNDIIVNVSTIVTNHGTLDTMLNVFFALVTLEHDDSENIYKEHLKLHTKLYNRYFNSNKTYILRLYF